MKKEFKKNEKIIIEDKNSNNLPKIKTNLSNVLQKVLEINKLICGNTNYTDLNSLLDETILKLKTVPYIPYPVSLSTVDMIAISKIDEEYYVLLGKKYKQTHWQFPGGFRDPGETSQEAAAREFEEECSLKIDKDRFKNMNDLFVDDKRYKDSCHKITTTMFISFLTSEEAEQAKGGDDIEMVKWFNCNELKTNKLEWIREVHHKIFDYIFNNPILIF